MAVILEAITHVWVAGRMVEPGIEFSTDVNYAKKLVLGGSAKIKSDALEGKEAKKNELAPEKTLEEKTKYFMGLKLEELKKIAVDNKVVLSKEDNTKAEITKKIIEAEVKMDEL